MHARQLLCCQAVYPKALKQIKSLLLLLFFRHRLVLLSRLTSNSDHSAVPPKSWAYTHVPCASSTWAPDLSDVYQTGHQALGCLFK